MGRTDQIRSTSVIGSRDHGKSTLTDSLTCKAGIISVKQVADEHEQERAVSVQSTGLSLYGELDEEDGKDAKPHLVNLIDSRGHVDFSSEVSAALRITDGAVVVVDCIEGCGVQTETVLRQSLTERVRPCLFVNKVDRCILELQMEVEDMYGRFRSSIDNVNVIIATYYDEVMGDVQVLPEKGTVAFGSGVHGWGFNLERFARTYSSKTGVDEGKMLTRLWGDNYYNGEKKTWTNVRQPEGCPEPLPRAFCQFIMTPINQFVTAIMNDKKETFEKMMTSLNIVLTADEKSLTGKALMKRAMEIWINAADALFTMIVTKLPSPRVAQKYRVENLYEGPMDDEAANAIRACEASGPLMMYVSKMVPTRDKDQFYAFGRVFSGTIATGKKVRIQGPHYRPGSKEDLNVKNVQQVVLMTGRATEQVAEVPCGNTVALVGIDQYLIQSGTITTIETAYNITDMKYSVSPVVKVAVKPRDGKDLPKLLEGLKRLTKSHPEVVCTTEESGEHIVAGVSESHLGICLRDLRKECPQYDFIIDEPVVSYRETVGGTSSQTCLAKSPNKHNRIYLTAEPLPEELSVLIEDGKAGPKADSKKRTELLQEQFAWDENSARKIWCWGPKTEGANLLVDQTQGVEPAALNEMKEHAKRGFQWASQEGPLCEESMRGIRFNIIDVSYYTDAIHRGAGQIVPPMRRCCYAAEMTAQPTLQEPVFLVEITCPQDAMSGVYYCMNLRRGCVFEENLREGTPYMQMKAHLPVAESFGFESVLRQQTKGQAVSQRIFDHWSAMPGNAMEAGKVQDMILAIRRRKNLKEEMPKLADYLDRL